MPTPTTAFADAAAKYGDIDPEDIAAVQAWFAQELVKLPPEVIENVLHDLLAQDGARPSRMLVPAYPDRAPLPSLGSSPHADPPRLADSLRRLIRRLTRRP